MIGGFASGSVRAWPMKGCRGAVRGAFTGADEVKRIVFRRIPPTTYQLSLQAEEHVRVRRTMSELVGALTSASGAVAADTCDAAEGPDAASLCFPPPPPGAPALGGGAEGRDAPGATSGSLGAAHHAAPGKSQAVGIAEDHHDAHAGAPSPRAILLLSNLAKTKNVGTLLRSACAFGVSEVWIVGAERLKAFGSQGTEARHTYRRFGSLLEVRSAALPRCASLWSKR